MEVSKINTTQTNSISKIYLRKGNNYSKILLLIMILLSSISVLDKNFYKIYSNLAAYFNFVLLISIILINNNFKFKKQYFEYFVILFTYCTFSLFINIKTSGIGSAIIVITGFLAYIVLSSYHISKDSIKLITLIFSVVSILLFISSNNYMQKFTLYPDMYINSNIIAAAALYFTIYLNILILELNIPHTKFLSFIFTIIGTLTILNCQSRASMLAIVSYLAFYYLIPKRLLHKRKFLNFILVSIILIGTLIPFIILFFYRRNIDLTLPLISKSLYTGREIIWNKIFDLLKADPFSLLFGLGSQIEINQGELLVAHNSYMAIIVNFGICGFMIIYGFIIYQFKKILKNVNLYNYEIKLFLGFICIFIHEFFEYTFLNPVFVLFTFLFLGLALNSSIELKKEKF